MPQVEVSRVLPRAAIGEVYAVLKDMESYPKFMPNLLSVKVKERGEQTTITEWKSLVDGMRIAWTEQDFFDDAALRIRYEQLDGDLEHFSGQWLLHREESGVKVTLRVDFSLGIPMVAELVHPLLARKIRQNTEQMLLGIQKMLLRPSAF